MVGICLRIALLTLCPDTHLQEDINRSTSLAQHVGDAAAAAAEAAGASGSGGQHVVLGENSPGYTADGEIISSQTVSSKTRTVETITVSLCGMR